MRIHSHDIVNSCFYGRQEVMNQLERRRLAEVPPCITALRSPSCQGSHRSTRGRVVMSRVGAGQRGRAGSASRGTTPTPQHPQGRGKGNGVVGMKPQSQPSRRRPRHCHGGLVTLGPAPGPPVTADPHQAGGGPASLPPAPQGPGAGTPVASCRLLHAHEDRAPGQLRPESGCVHTITDRDSKP